jgi:hypothetical protein
MTCEAIRIHHEEELADAAWLLDSKVVISIL